MLAALLSRQRTITPSGASVDSYGRISRYGTIADAGTFVDEHTAIVAAIKRRDKRAALALTRDHVESSRTLLLEQVGSLAVVP